MVRDTSETATTSLNHLVTSVTSMATPWAPDSYATSAVRVGRAPPCPLAEGRTIPSDAGGTAGPGGRDVVRDGPGGRGGRGMGAVIASPGCFGSASGRRS